MCTGVQMTVCTSLKPKGEAYLLFHFFKSFNTAIKFSNQISKTSVNFLVIKFSVNSSALTTTACYKSTDSHSYNLYMSYHQLSCKDAISSELSYLLRLCSDYSDLLPAPLNCLACSG